MPSDKAKAFVQDRITTHKVRVKAGWCWRSLWSLCCCVKWVGAVHLVAVGVQEVNLRVCVNWSVTSCAADAADAAAADAGCGVQVRGCNARRQ